MMKWIKGCRQSLHSHCSEQLMGEIYILGKLLFKIREKCARNVNRRSETKRNQNVNTACFYIDTL